jgi:DNA polymerase
MPHEIHLDFETRSESDLPKVGAWAYSEHPTTEVICACWAYDDEPVQEWRMGEDFSHFLTRADGSMPAAVQLRQPGALLCAHNAFFEYSIWTNVLKLLPWHEDWWWDTAASAAYYSLPRALGNLAPVLELGNKGADGGRLITKYSKLHLKTAQREIPEEDLDDFVKYCVQDVELERRVHRRLGFPFGREREVYLLDQRINKRGIRIDLAGVENASAIVQDRAENLAKRVEILTEGVGVTQVAALREWCEAKGVKLANLQAATLETLIEEMGALIPKLVREVIQLRLKHSKASTKKLDAMRRQRGKDGRARGQSIYHGANTGRWTGSGIQVLNLNRGFEDVPPEQLVRDISYRDARWLDLMYGDAMDAVGKASRHWIEPEPGSKIVAGDFVSIEAVVLACLAGETWKIQAFRDKVKLYERMGDKIYNLPLGTVTKATHPQERQDGKTGELACGYQGSIGAWRKFDSSDRHSDERVLEIVKTWRAEHPAIVKLWRDLETAALNALTYPGREFEVRGMSFEVIEGWLSIALLNGKQLWYWAPEIRMGMPVWHQPSEKEDCASGDCDCHPVPKLTYLSWKEGRWQRVYTYGGKLCENVTQATAREILIPAMFEAERQGYRIIMTVYDEIVAEAQEGFGSAKEFQALMGAAKEDWFADWPITADAWEGRRYKK